MKTKIKKLGIDLILPIPKSIVIETQPKIDSEVDIHLINGALAVTPAVAKNYTLEQFLSDITVENIHSVQDTGNPVGNETW